MDILSCGDSRQDKSQQQCRNGNLSHSELILPFASDSFGDEILGDNAASALITRPVHFFLRLYASRSVKYKLKPIPRIIGG